MTRRGTLAYYLAAWVIGCFVVSVLFLSGPLLAGEVDTASILLMTYFFSLALGAFAMLLFAFLLRRVMRLMGTHALWIWFLSGAILSLAEIFVLIHARSALLPIRSGQFGRIFFAAVLVPADLLAGRNFWQVPVDGAITALVLCLVDRPFAHQNEAAEAKQSPA